MMRYSNIRMTTRVRRTELLDKLKANLAEHQQIVQEAHAGYIEQAKKAIADRLDKLQAGLCASLQFSLNPPADHSEVYRTTIAMLEWNQDEFVELGADEFRQLVLDEWDWTHAFLANNSAYSMSALRKSVKQISDEGER